MHLSHFLGQHAGLWQWVNYESTKLIPLAQFQHFYGSRALDNLLHLVQPQH